MNPAPFSIDIAPFGGAMTSVEVPFPPMRDLGANAGDLRYTSEFLDAYVVSQIGMDHPPQYGFAIYAGTRSTISCGPGGGLLPPAFKTQVIIDAITIDPA
jgi:hypothetical protein